MRSHSALTELPQAPHPFQRDPDCEGSRQGGFHFTNQETGAGEVMQAHEVAELWFKPECLTTERTRALPAPHCRRQSFQPLTPPHVAITGPYLLKQQKGTTVGNWKSHSREDRFPLNSKYN